jgi:hypothetical protein
LEQSHHLFGSFATHSIPQFKHLDGNGVVRVCDDFNPTETDSPVSTNSGKRAPDQD